MIYVSDDTIKIGGLLVNYQEALVIRENVIDALKREFHDYPQYNWENIVDKGVYKIGGSGMRMIHTLKFDNCSKCGGTGKFKLDDSVQENDLLTDMCGKDQNGSYIVSVSGKNSIKKRVCTSCLGNYSHFFLFK